MEFYWNLEFIRIWLHLVLMRTFTLQDLVVLLAFVSNRIFFPWQPELIWTNSYKSLIIHHLILSDLWVEKTPVLVNEANQFSLWMPEVFLFVPVPKASKWNSKELSRKYMSLTFYQYMTLIISKLLSQAKLVGGCLLLKVVLVLFNTLNGNLEFYIF